MSNTQLPRLLYLADVPVESSYHGSMLLYRLLQCYPSNRLRIAEGNLYTSLPERRLAGIIYKTLKVSCTRLLHTRFHEWYSLWLALTSTSRAQKVPALLDGFEPEAVLTVAHGHLWVTAAEFARRRRLPLHLIVHDDWPRMSHLPHPFTHRIDRQFGSIYRAAASRLCVSPSMVEEYRRRYGADGQILYPSRAVDVQRFTEPPERLREANRGVTIAFAGSIHTSDYYRVLQAIADHVYPLGGRVLVFGPMVADQSLPVALNRPNIYLRGLLKSRELMERLRAEADVLLVPMSFDPGHRTNMEISFPSKLADYTAVGLPLLIYGPGYCSAVRWARENPGVAEVVTVDDVDRLTVAVDRLAQNPGYRVKLAKRALEVGQQFFSHDSAWNEVRNVLSSNTR